MHRFAKKIFVLNFLLLILPPELNGETIIIKTWNRENVSLDVDLSCTTKELKEKIYEKVGIPPYRQRLISEGRELKQSRSLSDYKIEEGYTIVVAPKVKENSAIFADVTKANESYLIHHSLSTRASRWRIVDVGLNMEGECLNRSCEAFHEKAICPIGICDYEPEKTKVFCTICLTPFVPSNCLYYLCQFRLISHKNGQEQKSQWYSVKNNDGITRINESDTGYTDFNNVTIQCVDLNTPILEHTEKIYSTKSARKIFTEEEQSAAPQNSKNKDSSCCIML